VGEGSNGKDEGREEKGVEENWGKECWRGRREVEKEGWMERRGKGEGGDGEGKGIPFIPLFSFPFSYFSFLSLILLYPSLF
jgi:hypothetical protein